MFQKNFMLQRILPIAFIILISLIGCEEPVEDKGAAPIDTDEGGEICVEVIEDTVGYVLGDFMSYVDSDFMESEMYAKRIDRILISRIAEVDNPDSSLKEYKIFHQDGSDFLIGHIIVPGDFDIESIHKGWVCSFRTKENEFNGPYAVYYKGAELLLHGVHENGVPVGTEKVYNIEGNIIATIDRAKPVY